MRQTVHDPDPTNDSSTSARNARCPPLSALGLQDRYFRHPTSHYPTSANSTWCHLWGALVLRAPYQYLLFAIFLELTIPLTRKFHPRRKEQIKKLQYYCSLGYVITVSQQIYTHDLPGTDDNFMPFWNSIPVFNEKLHSPTTISRPRRTNDKLRTIQVPS